jgi:NAD(P)-dependent dehydrogenase (short-subunit alcohol dehydrogenase family)
VTSPRKEAVSVRTDNDWDMHGKTILVTGGSGGIGLATARSLGRRGARIIITGRNQRRGEDAAAAIEAETGQTGSVTFMAADHSKVGGNQQLASQVWAQFGGMDVLINNVGGLYERRWETADGYEATLAMNFVGPFALTSELVPLLRANAPSRCVVVTSAAFKMWKGDAFDDVHSTTAPFVGSDAYARAKLLNVLFGLSLATKLAADHITVNLVHPGVTWTDMTRSQTWRTKPSWKWIWPIMRLIMRHGSPEKAAQRVAFLAFAPEAGAYTGQYFERAHQPKRLSARELDLAMQHRAWQLGAELVANAPTRCAALPGGGASWPPSVSDERNSAMA